MNKLHFNNITLLATLAASLTGGTTAYASDWPVQNITIVAPFTPGGTTDIIARAVANGLQAELNTNVIVENKPGAGGTVGAAYVAKAKPDGYTLLLANVGHVAAPALYDNLSYDFEKDLSSITNVANVPNVLIVNKNLPIKNTKDFIDYLKDKDGNVNYGSAGVGTTQHLSGELLKSLTKLKAEHVPYKGAAPMMTDLIGGRVDFTLDSAGSAAGHIKNNNVNAIGVTTLTRASAFPDLPTLDESGIPGYSMVTWYSLAAPAGLPKEVEEKIHQSIVKVMSQPNMQLTLQNMAAEPGGMEPEEFKKFVSSESKRWDDLIKNTMKNK